MLQKNKLKSISSTLYINGQKISTVSGSKTVLVDKNIYYTVSRSMFSTPGKHVLHVKVVSYLYTDFSVDGLMEDVLEKDIEINIDEKLIVPLSSKDVYIQKKEDNKLVVSPLVQTNITKNSNSYGFVEKGRDIAVKLSLNYDDINLEDIELYIDGNKTDFTLLSKNKKFYLLGVNINNENNITLMTWDYLRNKFQNYFDIDFKMVGNRIKSPCKIEILYSVLGKSFNDVVLIDLVDDYTKNINYIFENGIINKDEIRKVYSIEEL